MTTEPLDLPKFLPYRLSILSNRVSRELASVYADQFDLSIHEWRIMAVLGRFPDICANEVVERTAMDKVKVSRAVQKLFDAGRLQRERDPGDRRRQILSLSPAGRDIYNQIVPLARTYESRLLGQLPPEQRAVLDQVLALIETNMDHVEAETGKTGFPPSPND